MRQIDQGVSELWSDILIDKQRLLLYNYYFINKEVRTNLKRKAEWKSPLEMYLALLFLSEITVIDEETELTTIELLFILNKISKQR